MTFWSSNENYGQLLQAFALTNTLKKLEVNPYIIRYDGINDSSLSYSPLKILIKAIENPKHLLYKFKEVICKSKTKYNNSLRRFEVFRKEHLNFSSNYNTYDELKKSPPYAKAYICGSDMIWCDPKKIKPYFLHFAPSTTRKIAYAPSFGRKEISNSFLKNIKLELSSFYSVSVREYSGATLLKNNGITQCIQMPDPTLLLTDKEYVDLLSLTLQKHRENSLFAYILGNNVAFDSKLQEQLCNKHGLKYIYTAAHNRTDMYNISYPSIEEWITLIANSKYFITNSFHGCIFSIIFHTPFVFLPLTGEKSESNERIFSLLKKLNLENRIFRGDLNIIYNTIDFEKVDIILENWRIEGLDYLSNSLLNI